jgi:hypothetical protein
MAWGAAATSTTITSHVNKEVALLHPLCPSQCRSPTVREAADVFASVDASVDVEVDIGLRARPAAWSDHDWPTLFRQSAAREIIVVSGKDGSGVCVKCECARA